MEAIDNPHDKIFKLSMQDLHVAQDFFELHLPEPIKASVDLSTLSTSSEMLIDSNDFKVSIPDMLYTVRLFTSTHTVYLYPMIEHLSSAKEICVKVFEKKIKLMQRHRHMHHTKKFPFVYVQVLYHGRQQYHHSTDIRDYIDAPRHLIEDNLYSQLQLIDLNLVDDTYLQQHYRTGMIQLALKHIRSPELLQVLKQNASWLRQLSQESRQLLLSLLYYVGQVGNIKDIAVLGELIHQELPELEEEMQSVFEQLKQEGRQEGRQEGGMKVRRQLAKRLLVRGNLLISEISDLTDLAPETLRELEKESETV